MSVDIAWDLITAGPDGEALAESIRAFIHDKFQSITLPKFISTVHVHSFEFGSVCPKIEIKDICDPLPDFYEDDDEENSDFSGSPSRDPHPHNTALGTTAPDGSQLGEFNAADLHNRVEALQGPYGHTSLESGLSRRGTQTSRALQDVQGPAELLTGPFARSGTPGISGGTSNMGYFHLPVGGLSGAQTPLAAVAGGRPFATHAWLNDQQSHHAGLARYRPGIFEVDGLHESGSTLSRAAGSVSPPELGSPLNPSSPERRPAGYFTAEKVSDNISSTNVLTEPMPPIADKSSPSDLQVVARVTYNGDVRMLLTAEIMLDYPMPSFIKIPLRLFITGVDFDGVAILAYIKKNMHFCFLDPEDADTLVGSSFLAEDVKQPSSSNRKTSIGSLLREIRVETEIGRQESGKQVLKNVGKVEKFVLDQVRRIFEEEFVFPSFWTFLV